MTTLNNLQIFIISSIQGLTEFLPVSSSGHLIVLNHIFKWNDQGLVIDIAVHIGTIFAIIIYFFSYIKNIFIGTLQIVILKKNDNTKLATNIIIATIPIVIVGFLVKDFIQYNLRTLNIMYIVGFSSIVFAIILWFADNFFKATYSINDISKKNAFFLGIMQIFALIPGASRSGMCITASRMLKLKRTESAKISMLMGVPTILAASILIGYEIYQDNTILSSQSILKSIAFSFITAIFSIHIMIKWLQKSNMNIFCIYRIIFGAILIFLAY